MKHAISQAFPQIHGAYPKFVLGKKLITKLTGILGCDGYNLVQNNGAVAGQTVGHFHLHLIPRYEGDDAGLGWHMGSLDAADAAALIDQIKEEMD